MRDREESHVTTEGRPPCWCIVAPDSNLSGARHMHCRVRHRAFGRRDRLKSHEASHSEDAFALLGRPAVKNAMNWYSARITKRDMFSGMYSGDVLRSLRRAFQILKTQSIPPGVHNISLWRDIFNVREYQSHEGAEAQMVVACDATPRIWIFRCASRDEAMGVCKL